jgi:hypothetical protein
VTDHDCKKPSIANLDHFSGLPPERNPMVNRLCMTCLQHWYGNAGVAVVEMPRAVWDGWVNTMFDA